MATSRPSWVSVARYTSPMPPAPSGATISYGPILVPDVRLMWPPHAKSRGPHPATRRCGMVRGEFPATCSCLQKLCEEVLHREPPLRQAIVERGLAEDIDGVA